jgi:hypothetical protein
MNNLQIKREWLKSLVAALLCVALGGTALAARVHLKSAPTVEDIGENLTVCLALAGLGNKDVTITVAVTGTASVTYINPGGNEPAGQNKFPISAVTTETIPSTQIKNGTVSVCLTSPDIEVGDAPNPNWTVQLDDISFETATVTVVQGGKVVLKETLELEN